MAIQRRTVAWILTIVALVVVLAYWAGHEFQRYREAEDLQYELDAIAHVKRQLNKLTPGMTWPAVREVVFSGVRGNPHRGESLHRFVDNAPGVRRDVIQEPHKRFVVFEYGPNYAALLDKSGEPKESSGWQLLRFGESDEPYLE